MRLIATADLHYNHPRSQRLAEELIEQINALREIDALLLIGDTAPAEPAILEECLARFQFTGPKLFVAGNHELWSNGTDSHPLFVEELPRRVRSAGWQWLQTDPFVRGPVAIVGSIGWYDYSFAVQELGIPRRFYENKVAPGAAAQLDEFAHLLEPIEDVPAAMREVYARWNDGRFVHLGCSDEQFLEELLGQLQAQLEGLRTVPHIVAAVHHLPFEQLVPRVSGLQWEFARAFLGSRRIGELLMRFANVRQVLCGHSHFATETQIGHIQAINIGSGYRWKTYRVLELPD